MTWKTVSLSDVCNVSIGKTPPRGDKLYWDEEKIKNNVWLSIADLSSSNDKYISDSKEYLSNEGASLFKSVPKNTLIMSFKLSIGKLAFTKCELRTNEAIAALSILDESLILKEFLYYYLSSLNWDVLAGHDQKVKGKTLNKKKLNALEITLPPLAEQERIVARLDATFSEIDEAINKAEAKETEVQKLKTSLLSSSLNGDDLMWKKVKISDVCQIQPKKAQVKSKLKDSDEVSFMPMKDLGIQSIYPKSTQIKKLEKVYNSYTYFEDNDILLAKITPCFENGKLGIASNLINGVGFGSSEYIVLRCSEEVIPQYIYFCLNQPSFRIIGENQMSGAVGHKRVPIEYVENTKIYLPPIAHQERIVAKLDAANIEFRNANESIAKSKANYLALKAVILAQELQSKEAA